MRGKCVDLTGQRFGRLTVVEKSSPDKHGTMRWLCLCDCGTEKVIRGDKLRTGEIMSCGCFQRECSANRAKELGKRSKTHGLSGTHLYCVYDNMIKRCYNEKCERYPRYGGRGISVCKEWLDNRCVFYDWAINNGYEEGLTIDRIDVNSGYSPENCRWITQRAQANNRSTNVFLCYNGVSHTISEWSDITGIPRSRLYDKYEKGMTPEEILSK